jgi:hypothetical protein
MRGPWHEFKPSSQYLLSHVVAVCERRIAEGGVIRAAQKGTLVHRLASCAPPTIVWFPFSSGWGASPFNPDCWRTTDGRPAMTGRRSRASRS